MGSCSAVIVTIFNLLLLFSGISLAYNSAEFASLSSVLDKLPGSLSDNITDALSVDIVTAVFATGIGLCIMSVWGIVAFWAKKSWLLVPYTVVIIAWMIVALVIGVASIIYKDTEDFSKLIGDQLDDSVFKALVAEGYCEWIVSSNYSRSELMVELIAPLQDLDIACALPPYYTPNYGGYNVPGQAYGQCIENYQNPCTEEIEKYIQDSVSSDDLYYAGVGLCFAAAILFLITLFCIRYIMQLKKEKWINEYKQSKNGRQGQPQQQQQKKVVQMTKIQNRQPTAPMGQQQRRPVQAGQQPPRNVLPIQPTYTQPNQMVVQHVPPHPPVMQQMPQGQPVMYQQQNYPSIAPPPIYYGQVVNERV